MNSLSYIPLYQRLFNYYKQRIVSQDLRAGQKIDSINRMMERHQVSRETAKLVLKKLNNEGLIVTRAGKGSFVTQTTAPKKIWGIVLPFYSSNMEQLIYFLGKEAGKRGCHFEYFFGYNNPREEINLVGNMIREGYEAVIIVPNYDETRTAEFYRRLIPGNTNVILVDNTMAGSYFRYVIQSYDLGVKRAVEYLTLRNEKNLLLIKNDMWKGRNLLHELMEQTFRNVLDEEFPGRNHFVASDISEITQKTLNKYNIGGILCCYDTDAIKITGRLKKWNLKIPDDISVVAYGNTELIELFTPSITAIDCKYNEIASITAGLIDKGKACSDNEQYVIQPELIIRET